MFWGKFKSQEVIRTVSAVAEDDPYCLDSTQFILLFLHDRTLLAALPMLPEVGERCPAKGHCSAAMQLIQECSFVDVCSKAVTISKLPLALLRRLEDSWLPQLAAHTSKKLRLAREWKQEGLLLQQGTQLPGSEHRTLRGPRHLTLHPAQGHFRHRRAWPPHQPCSCGAFCQAPHQASFDLGEGQEAHLSGPAPEGQEQ